MQLSLFPRAFALYLPNKLSRAAVLVNLAQFVLKDLLVLARLRDALPFWPCLFLAVFTDDYCLN